MNNLLENKKVLIGVTASIAIYKTLELIRLLIKAGAQTRVIMSEEAKKFITPLTFEAISQNPVLHVETESWTNDNNHIHIGKWADILVIAPATANTINKTAHGIADNLLIQTLLAFNKQVLFAPSANTNMLIHPATIESIQKLKEYGYKIIDSQEKLLACNDKGNGAMAEPEEIFYNICSSLLRDNFWSGKDVIITGGGTKEKIDDVRYISNNSSGKMAKSLCMAAYYSGANVTYISTNPLKNLPKEIDVIYAPGSNDIAIALKNRLEKDKPKEETYLFMVAAVSDYICKDKFKGKLKKKDLGEEFSLKLIKNTDILKSIDKNVVKTVGFKAETDKKNALQNAREMLINKNLDAVCLNIIDDKNSFGSDTNEITLITKNNDVLLELNSKLNISFQLLKELKCI